MKRWKVIAPLVLLAALIARGWWRTFEWGTPERLEYSCALRSKQAGQFAWGRPRVPQPLDVLLQLEADVARTERKVSVFERWIIRRKAA